MKRIFSFLIALLSVCLLPMHAQTVGIIPFGYGAGATGGGSATPTLVSTLSELKSALSSNPTDKVIIITKDITVDGVIQVKDGSNLTLMALPGVKIIATNWDVALKDGNKLTGIFEFTRIDNLIIRNLTLEGPGAYDCDGRDHITLQSVTNAWIDHCDFSDAVDDCMDIKNTSDNITISWCRFHYDKPYHPNGPGDASGDKDHRFVSLLGSSSSDKPSDGTYNVTYAYLWFDEGCMQRMIRCRNADLHFLGCYWNSSEASYYIGPENVSAYIELCTFEGGPKASNIYKSYNSTNNPVKFVNTVSAKGLPSDYGTVSAPSYSYAKYASAAEAKTAVTDPDCGAGATLIVGTDGSVASGCSVSRVKYTVTFNANGGSGSMNVQEGYEEANTTLNPCTFTAPSGKAFAGWNTASDGSGTAYADQGVIVLTENTTLYAQWAQAYTVTYNNNGHGTAPAAVTVGSGSKLIEPEALTESGWVFGGWYKDQACTSAWDFATMSVTADMTLHAKWTIKTCEEQVWYNTLPTGVAQANCFTFATTPTGSSTCDVTMTIDGTEYHAERRSSDWNSTFTFTVPTGQTGTLYVCAKSSGSTRTVTIADGGGTLAVEGSTIKTYASQTLNAGTYTVSTSGNIHIAMLALQLCGSSQVSEEKTYYDVTFDTNGHGTAPATQSVIENGLVSEPVAPTESGWVFGGWYKEQTCVTPWSFTGDLVTAATTLYAKWTEQIASVGYTISYIMNGHGQALSSVNNATTLPASLPIPAASGYSFGGWYTDAAFTTKAVAGATLSADITLYAKWTASSEPATPSTGENEGGWFEACWMEFELNGYSSFVGYISSDGGATWTKLDAELVRSYGTYGRVDAVGLTAGNYLLKVVPVTSSIEQCAAAIVSGNLVVKAHDRHGFAHTGTYATEGIGAYNNDGTLKSGARVLYVTAANAKTVSLSMQTSSSAETTCTGLQAIISAYEKGYESRPLAIRILGTITADDMDYFGSSAEGLQVKGKEGYSTINLTLEGIGKDAAIHGFGILGRNISSAEFRNFAILNCMDDCLGLDTKNSYVWIHHLDFFYGQAGSASDQAKGDGTVDLKGDSKWITISYNHFFDSGKMSLCGMKSETGPNYITYHHNWFDHSDSRHPRIRTMSVHIFNNYFDGNSKYGVGVTMGSSAFVECNYYRACSKPMMSSMQGTDAQGEGTFSSEDGGIIKAYNNHFATPVSYITYQQNATSFDAYEVSNRTAQVPSNVVTVAGGTTYDNFDTQYANMYSVTPDDPMLVPDMVKGTYGAGRMQHGDIEYTFSEADDSSYAVNTTLKNLVVNYTSPWSGIIIGTTSATECADIVEGHILLAEVIPAGYGTVSRSSILGIADNTAITASGNVLTVGETAITATPSAATAAYTYAFDQWTWTPEVSTITAHVTATASFTRTANGYTLTWDVNGGNALSGTYTQGTVVYGTPIVQPAAPTREGYTFLGWSPLPAATMPAANTTYVAQWKDNSITGYTITYNMNGYGDQIQPETDATTLPASLPTPTAEGYTFGGWYTDAALTNAAVAGATLKADITLYAKWTANASGGSASGYEWYVEGKKGNNDFYTVTGNYSNSKGTVTYNGKSYSECLKIESSTNITFTLTEKVTMTFVFNPSGKFKIDGTSYTTDANGVCTVELAAGTHTITKVDGINLFYINAEGSASMVFTATISTSPAAYGSVSMSSIADIPAGTAITQSGNTLTIGSTTVTATPATATAEYTYAFDSWTINPAGNTVTADITITAIFTRTANSYTLTWNANGGVLTGEYTQGTVAYGTTIVPPAAPTREGYTFLGWSPLPAATMPAANTTYTAQWEAIVITETTFHTAGNWSAASNWTNGLPSESLIANIEANCVVDIPTAVAKQVRLKSGNTLTVAPAGGLQITEDIKRQGGTTLLTGDLTIQSNSTNQGAIVIGTEDGNTPATVEFYSKAYKDAHTHYQYIGIPFSNAPLATDFFTGSYVYTYQESTGWVKATTSTTLQAFTGYSLSQTAAKTYTMQGQLCASATKSIPLTYSAQNGANLVGNSWMAPLQINNFEDADFPEGAEKTIFIYNTGSKDEYTSNNGSSSFGSKPGQYFSIPIHAAPYADGLPTAIPPMQAFQVNTKQAGSLTLNYARLTGGSAALSTEPLRAPRALVKDDIAGGDACVPGQLAAAEVPIVLRIAVSGNEGTASSDQVYLMQRADFTDGFDNGWDGTKMQGDANLLSLYTADNKAIDARQNMIGTQLVFRAGEEQTYTLAYEYNGSEMIYLHDAKTNMYSPISDGGTYAFSSTAAEVSARFRIASAEEALQTPTGTEHISMQDGILYNPSAQEMHIRIFDARGCLLMQTTTSEAIFRMEGYGNGVYIMEVTTGTQRQVMKIINCKIVK